MAEASDLLQQLIRRQNTDGGWGYQGATSWTEPTALAVLAFESADERGKPYDRGCRWLLDQQRHDGGWGPNAMVPQSTSVTSTACLALSSVANVASHDSAVRWILEQIKPDLNPAARLEFWLNDMPPAEVVMGGSPWYPGTAAWIFPTVMSVLALAEAREKRPPTGLRLDHAIQRGRAYILSRQCQDGGWNHGGTQFRGAAANSYPEMTGMALLALDGMKTQPVAASLHLAQTMRQHAESSEGQSWLTLALRKHEQSGATTAKTLPPRTTRDISLRLLALETSSGNNKFLTRTT